MLTTTKNCPTCRRKMAIYLQVCDCGYIFYGDSKDVRALARKNLKTAQAGTNRLVLYSLVALAITVVLKYFSH